MNHDYGLLKMQPGDTACIFLDTTVTGQYNKSKVDIVIGLSNGQLNT